MKIHAAILNCAGLSLTQDERAFFTQYPPAGFILFERNCHGPAQIQSLIADLSSCYEGDYRPFILIDQEGGRVLRLKPPHWTQHEAARAAGLLYEQGDETQAKKMTFAKAMLMGAEAHALGIDVITSPVLDVLCDDTHDVIGDRAFSSDPHIVAQLGAQLLAGLRQEKMIGVIKHALGHGRAQLDSHEELPYVSASIEELRARDFIPFCQCAPCTNVWMMTAHIAYDSLDDEILTFSPQLVADIIRGEMGFDGVLISDDLAMGALCAHDLTSRAQRTRAAGHDLALYCIPAITDMTQICEGAGFMTEAVFAKLMKSRNFVSTDNK